MLGLCFFVLLDMLSFAIDFVVTTTITIIMAAAVFFVPLDIAPLCNNYESVPIIIIIFIIYLLWTFFLFWTKYPDSIIMANQNSYLSKGQLCDK